MLTEEQLRAKLLHNAAKGALIQNWVRHPAFTMFYDAIQEELDDRKQKWFKGTKEDAENARNEAKGLHRALEILQIFKNSGYVAKKTLLEHREDLDNPTN